MIHKCVSAVKKYIRKAKYTVKDYYKSQTTSIKSVGILHSYKNNAHFLFSLKDKFPLVPWCFRVPITIQQIDRTKYFIIGYLSYNSQREM